MAVRPRSTGPALTWRTAVIARLAYVGVVLLATLSDLYFDPNTADVPFRLARAFDLRLHMHDAVDGVRNLALFAGLGAVWVVTSRTGRVWRSTWHVTALGCALSVMVETLQLFSPVRNASIIDVTTNTIGALAGAILIDLVIVWVHSAQGKKSYVGLPAFTFAAAYGVATLMETFAPLFRDASLPKLGGGLVARVGRAWDAMRFGSIVQIPVLDVLVFAPAGAFLVAAFAESGVSYRAAWVGTALAGLVACTLVEILHGAAAYPIQLGAILTHAVAIAVGAWASATWLPRASAHFRGARRPRALFLLYIAIIAIWSWRPFIPELSGASIREQFSAVHWVPMRALAIRVDLFTVTDVVTQFLLYMPLGALLAVWPLRDKGAWRHLLPAIYLSIVMELGKIVIEGRFFDVTHILIQVSGAAMGWIILRRSGFLPYGEVWDPA